jgi:hypothetical protein
MLLATRLLLRIEPVGTLDVAIWRIVAARRSASGSSLSGGSSGSASGNYFVLRPLQLVARGQRFFLQAFHLRHERGQRLNSQAAVEIWVQQSSNPFQIVVAMLQAVFAAPQSHNRNEPRFVVRNEHKPAGESCNFAKCAMQSGRQRSLDSVGFVRLSYKLDTQRGNSGNRLVAARTGGAGQRELGRKEMRIAVRTMRRLQRSWHNASSFTLPGITLGEGASSPVQVQLRCAWWDTRGTGIGPYAEGNQRCVGFLRRIVQQPRISFHACGPKRELPTPARHDPERASFRCHSCRSNEGLAKQGKFRLR